MAYLSVIDKFSRLRYVFNDRKRNITQAKEKMKAVFQGSKKDEIFDVIWNNNNLRISLFGDIPANQLIIQKPQRKIAFNQWVESLDDKIYIFVDVN